MKQTAASVCVIGLALAILPGYVIFALGDNQARIGRIGFLGDLHRLGTERLRAEELQQANDSVQSRVLEKLLLAARVADGKVSLLDAAARFRQLDGEKPLLYLKEFRLAYPGRSDDERYCRQVIAFVRGTLSCQPHRHKDVVRLEAELEQTLRDGSILLPPQGPEASGRTPRSVAASGRTCATASRAPRRRSAWARSPTSRTSRAKACVVPASSRSAVVTPWDQKRLPSLRTCQRSSSPRSMASALYRT